MKLRLGRARKNEQTRGALDGFDQYKLANISDYAEMLRQARWTNKVLEEVVVDVADEKVSYKLKIEGEWLVSDLDLYRKNGGTSVIGDLAAWDNRRTARREHRMRNRLKRGQRTRQEDCAKICGYGMSVHGQNGIAIWVQWADSAEDTPQRLELLRIPVPDYGVRVGKIRWTANELKELVDHERAAR